MKTEISSLRFDNLFNLTQLSICICHLVLPNQQNFIAGQSSQQSKCTCRGEKYIISHRKPQDTPNQTTDTSVLPHIADGGTEKQPNRWWRTSTSVLHERSSLFIPAGGSNLCSSHLSGKLRVGVDEACLELIINISQSLCTWIHAMNVVFCLIYLPVGVLFKVIPPRNFTNSLHTQST